jgi:hypothetical protein
MPASPDPKEPSAVKPLVGYGHDQAVHGDIHHSLAVSNAQVSPAILDSIDIPC